MTFAIGLTISFILISLFIYVLPIISNKISLSVLLIITTLAFVLSSLMAKLYSPLVGIGIFLLLIGSLSLLIGKKRMWLETTPNKKGSSSRRKRFKELSVIEGTILENLSSVDDHMLYHKTKDDYFDDSQSPKSVIDLKGMHSEINLGEYEIAAAREDVNYNDESDIVVDEIKEEKILYQFDSEDDIKQDNQTVSNDELSDQWMEKRLQSLFDNEKISDDATKESSFENISDMANSRYEDLSEGYFNQSGSGINGSKE